MFQHDNLRPHVARICTQFFKAENVSVLPWPAYSPCHPLSMFGMLWTRHIQQRGPVPTNINNFIWLLKEWENIPQATINLTNSM
ncbi:hypothetical protein LDENG_00027030 [Lucifuga dentata]|nr:hypothetical protein LDENG_00027030 [Lucifuga dentata]